MAQQSGAGRAVRRASHVALAFAIGACSAPSAPSAPSTTVPVSAPPTGAVATPRPANPTLKPAPTLPPGITEVRLSFRPSGLLVAGDLIWAEDHAASQSIYAVDPATGKPAATFQFTRPCDLVQAAGFIWVADVEDGTLTWIDPDAKTIGGAIPDLDGACAPQFVGGAIWVAVRSGIARIDPESREVAITELRAASFPGIGEPLWAVDFDFGDLNRIDPKTGKVLATVAYPGGVTMYNPTLSAFGSLWVGNSTTRSVYRLDPKSGAIQTSIPTIYPSRLFATADSVWLTSYDGGAVERIDPATNSVSFHADLGGNINGIGEGLGGVWVGDTMHRVLYRIDPALARG
jgi:streptogramin lyase